VRAKLIVIIINYFIKLQLLIIAVVTENWRLFVELRVFRLITSPDSTQLNLAGQLSDHSARRQLS